MRDSIILWESAVQSGRQTVEGSVFACLFRLFRFCSGPSFFLFFPPPS